MDLNQIANNITDIFKQVIKDKNLIDTGELYNSINTKVKIENNSFTFEIEAVYYFTYLDNEYSITKTVLDSQQFNTIQNQISDYLINQMLTNI